MSIPQKAIYQTKVIGAHARSTKSNIQPEQGTMGYGLGSTININIPTGPNSFLVSTESYLRLDHSIQNTSGAAISARWDSCGAHGLFKRIRIWHGSNLMEDLDDYGLLAKMLYDIQVHTDASYGKYNILSGTRNDLYVEVGSVGNPITTQALTSYGSAKQVNSGELITSGLASGNAYSTPRTYCLNLISFIGSLCGDKYFPLFACQSADLRVELTLVDSIQKAMCVTGTNDLTTSNCKFKLDNVEYVATNIELGNEAMAVVNSSIGGGPLEFVIPQYRNYQYVGNTIPSGTDFLVQMPIPAKFSSVKSIFVCARDMQTGADDYFPFSCTTCGTFKEYSFRIGLDVFPPKSPYSTVEAFAELMKAIGSISDLNNTPSIELESYSMTESIDVDRTTRPDIGNVNSGSFYVGLDLENFIGANKDHIFAGRNTQGENIYYNYSVKGGTTAVTPLFDSFVLFDCIFVFEYGTAFTKI